MKRILILFALSMAMAGVLIACRPKPRPSPPEPSQLTILQGRTDPEAEPSPAPEAPAETEAAELETSQIWYLGKAYRYRGPESPTDAVDSQELGTLSYDPQSQADLCVNARELAGWQAARLSGGEFTTDALLVSRDQDACLFYPEGFWEAIGGDYLYEDNKDGGVTLLKYLGWEKTVAVPAQLGGKPVTRLGMAYLGGVFASCGFLEEVTLPEGVALLDDNTFYGCPRLKSVRFPASLTGLGHCCFQNCPALEGLYFASDAPATGNYLFDGASAPTLHYPSGTEGWDRELWSAFPADPD